MRVLVIDDDRGYCEILLHRFQDSEHEFICCSTSEELSQVDVSEFKAVIVDHTLDWAKGVDEIYRLSPMTNAVFALVSTTPPELFTVDNIVSDKIRDIFDKWEWKKVDEFLDLIPDLLFIGNRELNPSKHGTQKENKASEEKTQIQAPEEKRES